MSYEAEWKMDYTIHKQNYTYTDAPLVKELKFHKLCKSIQMSEILYFTLNVP